MPQLSADNPPPSRLRALSIGLRARGVAILHQDAEGRYDLAENLPLAWPADIIGKTDAEILPPLLADHITSARRQCVATGLEQIIDFELPEPTRRRRFEARFSPDTPGVVITLFDITDERNREVAVTTLLREVSHRSKNLLAIVQSVAMQTAHHSGDIKDFLDKFRGRLHALSSTQDLVTESNWRGTHFQTLVMSQLARVSPAVLKDTRITGDNPLLGPNASLHIGLAIHELAANAVIHGALAEEQAGHVWVNAQIEKAAGLPEQLIIEWQETGIDTQQVRQAPRFGTMVLERIVPLSVGGSAHFEIDDDKVRYRLAVPSDQFEP
ncbi:MAG: Two-component sensor histidine kinase, contains HisKA and HATPase domain [Devosia sp.]|uniref:sensor histidine kinase n=1 Tax=Devosia sp. TaxID=1871048 RepID=UPI0026068A22|nr:PAS domain-containing sensor histidine kinase [Devosia sp.]MDB5527593.1 Two-component sensor histidine kinase, contains HisKA and HATPase domain [Devosia sp.]